MALGKVMSKGDEENLNLVTMSSVWELKAVVIKKSRFLCNSSVFMYGGQWRDQKRQYEIYNYAFIWP